MLKPIPFRFDHVAHVYTVQGSAIPHITGMIEQDGLVDPRWFRDEHRERGTAVHQLTAEYDMGALDVARLVSKYRGYVLAHVGAMAALKPEWLTIEEPEVHPKYVFGGTADRVGRIYKAMAVLDEKSGVEAKAHKIQTALQAILVAWRYDIEPEAFQRFGLYVKASGKFKNRPHVEKRDYDEAYRLIRKFCGKG